MMNKARLLLTITFLALFWLAPLQAEDENEGVGVLLKITPKAGHDEALLKGITDYHHWVAQFDGHMKFNWWKITTGPDTGKYYAYSGDHNWADFDAEYDWEEKSNEMIAANVLPHIENMQRSMHVDMDKVSYWPEDWTGYTHLQAEAWYIKNGQFGAFNKGLKRVVDALKAGGFPHHFGFSRVASGGHGNQVDLLSPVQGWGGMSDKKPTFYDIMVEELGSEEAFNTFMAEWGETFKPGHNEMLEFMPKASDYGED
jgi:hypothetical protein